MSTFQIDMVKDKISQASLISMITINIGSTRMTLRLP